jgi:hypothetical protein
MTAQRLEKWLKAGADEAEQDLTINFHLAGPAGTVLTSACHQYDIGQAEGGWSARRDSESATLRPLCQQSPSVEFEASLRYTVDFCASLLASDAPDASHHPGRHRLRSKRLPPRPRQPIAKTDGKQCISKRRRHRLTPRRYPLTDKRRCRYVSTHHYSSAMDQSSASLLVPHHPQPGLFAQAANLEATRGVSRRQQGTAPGPERSSGLRSHRGNTAEWCDLASGTSCGQ